MTTNPSHSHIGDYVFLEPPTRPFTLLELQRLSVCLAIDLGDTIDDLTWLQVNTNKRTIDVDYLKDLLREINERARYLPSYELQLQEWRDYTKLNSEQAIEIERLAGLLLNLSTKLHAFKKGAMPLLRKPASKHPVQKPFRKSKTWKRSVWFD